MRLLPAHVREAKDMAKGLQHALAEMGLLRDCRDPESGYVTLQQAQELMAKAMGYDGGWKELKVELERPHQPVYINEVGEPEGSRLHSEAAGRLARLLGYHYMHGHVYEAFGMGGVGFSPKFRRVLSDKSTPWGVILDEEEVRPGIHEVSTSGHGGLVVSEERQSQIPAHLRLDEPYYEEDTDWALVILSFPSEFPDGLKDALASVGVYQSRSVPRIRDNDPKWEKFLSETMIGYVPPDKDPMNRATSPDEESVIRYLASCVRSNSRPVSCPEDEYPSLQDWVDVLRKGLRVDGEWPMLPGPWQAHWGQWQRNAEMERKWREEDARWMKEIEEGISRGDDSVD